ncbi:hypothetical protein CRYUN_Cryun15aG0072200 [Craigia yunnanensis]
MKRKFKANGWIGDSSQLSLRRILSYSLLDLTGGFQLQISEVVNSMKDLIDYSQETGMGPMESLAKFPRSSPSSAQNISAQQPEERPQITGENANNDSHSVQSTVLQPSTSNVIASVNNSQGATSTSTSATTIVGLLR